MKKFVSTLIAASMVGGMLAACGGAPAASSAASSTATDTTTSSTATSTDAAGGGSKVIGVVAKGESHAFWQAVKAGATDAAAKYGYTITFRGPASESAKDLPSQMEMVQTALSNNVDGLVLATIGEGFTDMLTQAYDGGIPVVQFDSGIWENDVKALDAAGKNPIISAVATSNRDAAGVAAEHFFELIKGDIAAGDGYVVGVIQHDQTQTGVDRAGGFVDKFKELADADATTKGKYTIETEVKDGDANNAYVTALEALYEKGAKAVFMCNEGVVKQVSDAIAAAGGKYDEIKFCGFDAGTKQIQWIKSESGAKLVGSVAQDSYNIGFNAVEQCINAIEKKEIKDKVAIAGAWYDASNIDDMITKNLVYEG
ncbi:MAG: substrate-binding domain-containing protein [Gemmiger sp.]|nr:substrate-binding domain-containing protein [Gemmiger sp.]